MNSHFFGCLDTDSHLIAFDAEHGDGYIVTDH